MEARRLFSAPFLGAVVSWIACTSSVFGASARTQNFMVTASTQELATEIATAAEAFRKDLAIEWLGQELPNWQQPCPITAQVSPSYGAGGATSFMFSGGRPHGWTMSVQGSRERVLDSVLPHEVTHTIFATHFGRPLPRWADEGACTTVEHASEKEKQEKNLYVFLKTNRGIAFNQMFAMKDYPRDILPLYSQGYSLARFLIALGGKPKFVKYVGEGMDTNNWTATTRKHYGFHSLSDLQQTWLEWVRTGTPKIASAEDVLYVSTDKSKSGRTLAEVSGQSKPATEVALSQVPANLLPPLAGKMAAMNDVATTDGKVATPEASEAESDEDGWYSRKSKSARAKVATRLEDSITPVPSGSLGRPQSPERVRPTVLEWSKDGSTLEPAKGNAWR